MTSLIISSIAVTRSLVSLHTNRRKDRRDPRLTALPGFSTLLRLSASEALRRTR
jgi:hypothetical protein